MPPIISALSVELTEAAASSAALVAGLATAVDASGLTSMSTTAQLRSSQATSIFAFSPLAAVVTTRWTISFDLSTNEQSPVTAAPASSESTPESIITFRVPFSVAVRRPRARPRNGRAAVGRRAAATTTVTGRHVQHAAQLSVR